MDPAMLFPWLAAGFALAGVWRLWRSGRLRGGSATWLLLALIFAAVAAWLRWQR
ncbi:MAG TPA: hypothetical protein VIW70_08945 [Rubrivivax sp.]